MVHPLFDITGRKAIVTGGARAAWVTAWPRV